MQRDRIILSTILLLAAGLAGCDRGTNPGTVTEPVTETPSDRRSLSVPSPAAPIAPRNPVGPARMEFTSHGFHFGEMYENESRSTTLRFTNMGGETLTILDVKTTCGCTVPTLSKRVYAPGESGALHVIFNPGGAGASEKYVNLVVEGQGLVRLPIKADVMGFLDVEPRILKAGRLVRGERFQGSFTVILPSSLLQITDVTTSNPHFTAVLRNVEPAERTPGLAPEKVEMRIDIEVDTTDEWGSLFSWVNIKTAGIPYEGSPPIDYAPGYRVQGEVFASLIAEPNTFRFGTRPGNSFQRDITLVHRENTPFSIRQVAVNFPGMVAEVQTEQVSPSEYRLVLVCSGSERASRYSGTVTVLTDVAGDKRLEIPIAGVVRSPADIGR